MSAALLLVVFVTALGRTALTRWGGLALAAVTLLACVSGVGLFKAGPSLARANAPALKMRLAALEAKRGAVAADAQIDTASNPDIQAEKYFIAVEKHGSPAPSLDEVRAAPDAERQVFDATLTALSGIALTPSTGTVRGRCTTVAADGEAPLEPGTYRLTAEGAPAELRLRRLATTIAPDAPAWALADGAAMTLELGRDAVSEPWRGKFAGAPVRVCRNR
jgi:hypothetical protein